MFPLAGNHSGPQQGKKTTTNPPHQLQKKVLEVVLEQGTLIRARSLEMTRTGLSYKTILYLEKDYKSPLGLAQLYHTTESSTLALSMGSWDYGCPDQVFFFKFRSETFNTEYLPIQSDTCPHVDYICDTLNEQL